MVEARLRPLWRLDYDPGMPPHRIPLRTDEIVVVAGIPRSGTSLLMQMLEAGGVPPLRDEVREPDEDNPRGYYELEAAKRLARDASWLGSARGHAVKIVHSLISRLPADFDYRVVLVERRLDEVLASQERMLVRLGGSAETAKETVLPADRLAQIFASQLVTVMAWLDAQPNLTWLHLSHGDLIAEPRESAARIDDFLGGALDRVAMAAAVEPDLHRVRADAPPVGDPIGR